MQLLAKSSKGTWPLQPSPTVNTGFSELLEVSIEAPQGGPWSFRVDDEPLLASPDGWHWRPGFFAGQVRAELLSLDGRVCAEYLFDVSPSPAKLGRDRFDALLQEIISEDPALVIGEEPSTLLSGQEQQLKDPVLALLALARLRTYLPKFIRALEAAERQPRMTTRRARALLPPHKVRRVDLASIRPLAQLIAGKGSIGRADQIQVDVPVTECHVDGAANRCVLAIIHSLLRRVRAISQLLVAWRGERESETRTPMAARLPQRLLILRAMESSLEKSLRRAPWLSVTRAEVTAAGLTAIASDPLYARVHQMGWSALRTGFGGGRSQDRMWMSPTWEIFERWCFVRVARLVRTLRADLSWRRLDAAEGCARAQATWEGRGPHCELRVLLQPTFPSGDQPERWGMRSISREREPDLAITYQSGETRRLIILDAKYTQSRSGVLEAMQSAHIYRDSLRWHGQAPEIALLLIPALSDAAWLGDVAFQRKERVGTAVLDLELPELIRELIL